MKRLFRLLHHRSLTVSTVALFFGFMPWRFIDLGYWLHKDRAAFLTQSLIVAALGVLYCTFTLVFLLRDNRSGYPSFRCSLATLLWGSPVGTHCAGGS